jgi:three-Cys-motif partner protein
MGRVPRNAGADTRSLKLFPELEHPPAEEGVVEFPSTFQSNAFDGYPVWTENKSKLIAQYVYHFIMVTKHGVYLDGFAGPQVEEFNDTSWSAKRVLEIRPDWIKHFILCDLEPAQVAHLQRLKAEREQAGDKRKIDIYEGGFNVNVDRILASDVITEKVATFCVLDQRNMECKWETVRKLAQHKHSAKIELFYFLPVGWLSRVLAVSKQAEKIREWWGRDDVDVLKRAALKFRDMAALFTHRFQTELQYKSVLAWPIHDRGSEGRVMFYIVHATDHPAAPKLMNRAYWKSTHAAEPMEHLQTVLDGFDLDSADLSSPNR